MVRSFTLILGPAPTIPLLRFSNTEDIGDGGDDCGGDHDADDAGDHGRGGGLTDRRGAAPAADAAHASSDRYQHPENGTHEQAEKQVVEVHCTLRLEQVLHRADVEHRAGDDEPTGDSQEICAPNLRSSIAPTNARMSPTSRLMSATMGSDRAPQS